MSNDWKKYMNDPSLVDEPLALREIHAIRLQIYEETKDMSPSEHTEFTNRAASAFLAEHGLSHLMVKRIKKV